MTNGDLVQKNIFGLTYWVGFTLSPVYLPGDRLDLQPHREGGADGPQGNNTKEE